MTEKKITAADKRYDAIGEVVSKYCNETNNYKVTASRKEIATDIMSLERLGRTLRWKNAVIKWRDFVMDQPDADLHWCLIQGSMFALWEAN